MADPSRDLKVGVLSDTDRFNLAKPADELDELAQAAGETRDALEQLEAVDPRLDRLERDATGAAQELDDLGDAGRDVARKLDADLDKAGDTVDDLGDQARETAQRVDAAMDKIAAASKKAGRDVDAGMTKAEEGVEEFRDEAQQSGREAAASFSGEFEDVADLIQETAANAFAGFGPLGMAAGMAAAVGIGFATKAITEARERVKELAAGLLDLKLDAELDTVAGRIRNVLDTLKDTGDLARFREATRKTGVSWSEWVRAMSGDEAAMGRVRAQLAPMIDSFGGAEAVLTDTGRAANDLSQRLREQREALELADAGAVAYADESLQSVIAAEEAAEAAAEEHAAAAEAVADAVTGSFDRIADSTTGLSALVEEEATAQAEATKDPADSWEDYADAVELSAADVARVLDEQTTAANEWRSNLLEVQKNGDAEFLAWVAEQPPQVAAAYASGTAAEQATIYNAFKRYVGAKQAAGILDGLLAGKPAITAGAQQIHDAAREALNTPVTIPTDLDPPARSAVESVVSAVRGAIGTLTIPVMLQNVPQSVWERPRPMG